MANPKGLTMDPALNLRLGLDAPVTPPAQETGNILPSFWNQNIKAALASSATSTFAIHVLGASIAAGGTNVTDVLTDSYPAQLTSQLVTDGVPRAGDYFSVLYSSNWSPTAPISVRPCTFDIAPTAWARRGHKWCATHSGTGVQTYLHFTHPSTALGYNARAAYLLVWDLLAAPGVTWAYNINGGSDVIVTNQGLGVLKMISLGTLPNQAANVINIHNQSNGSTLGVMGILWLTGTTLAASPGVVMIWDGATGQLGEIGQEVPGGVVTDRISQHAGPTTNPVTSAVSGGILGDAGIPTRLFIVDIWDDIDNILTGQGSGASKTPAQPEWPADPATYARYMGKLRSVSQACPADMLVHLPFSPSGTVSDITLAAGYAPQNYEGYVNLLVPALSSRKTAFVMDAGAPGWGEQAVANGLVGAANPHPTRKGYADVTQRFNRAIRSGF